MNDKVPLQMQLRKVGLHPCTEASEARSATWRDGA
jgi:hypothetical protein